MKCPLCNTVFMDEREYAEHLLGSMAVVQKEYDEAMVSILKAAMTIPVEVRQEVAEELLGKGLLDIPVTTSASTGH